jgi:quercetin dioxygenase-like cupin family protein
MGAPPRYKGNNILPSEITPKHNIRHDIWTLSASGLSPQRESGRTDDLRIFQYRRRMMKRFWIATVFLLATSPLQALENSSVVVTPVLSTNVTASGQPIKLPEKDAQVVVSTFEIAPGAALPVHKHPYPRYGYVLAGTLEVTDVETGKSTVYKPGEFIVETIGQWHKGANIGTEPLKILVIDQVEQGQTNTILRK